MQIFQDIFLCLGKVNEKQCPVIIHSAVHLIQRQCYIGRRSNSCLSALPEQLCPLPVDFVSTHFFVSLAYFSSFLGPGTVGAVFVYFSVFSFGH